MATTKPNPGHTLYGRPGMRYPTPRRITAQELHQVARELDTMAERLRADVRPGHVNYISKRAAGDWVEVLAENVRGHVADFLTTKTRNIIGETSA